MRGPDTKFMMMWDGQWRPVTNMFAGHTELFEPTRATSAVLWVAPQNWQDPAEFVPVAIQPGDIIERVERDHSGTDWSTIN